jgi:hypothetical protein
MRVWVEQANRIVRLSERTLRRQAWQRRKARLLRRVSSLARL